MVRFETTLGDFSVELDEESAPVSSKNFLRYVDAGYFDGTVFHRVIPGFMIQGGGFTADMKQKPTHAPIKNEAANGLREPPRHARDGAHQRPGQRDRAVLRQPRGQRLPRPPPAAASATPCSAACRRAWTSSTRSRRCKTGRSGGHDDVPAEAVVIKAARRATAA